MPVPPLAFTVALPVLLPKQVTFVCAPRLALNELAGCVMVAFTVVVQPFASEIVQLYMPAGRLLAVAVACTGEEFQL